ncbi:hypothetical protein [Sphingomonas sp.]|uniref:hypothetical protein n=1 Tax=Sphingomonas sp. TaxID=28214 RepID=UPI001EB97350|nr:hypothetical protein [Sphingomonas sp.]MBX3594106.1 hypothetical protein [Sphingomonas sp.]
MRLDLGGAFADAAALWRADRDLIVRIAGVFLFLPILALAMLATGIALPEQAAPEQVREAVGAFYQANLVWVLLISVMLDYGAFALLRLFLQRGESVRELLLGSLVRLLPFVLIGLAVGALMQLGFTLLIIPGIYVFGRTWLMGPAYAASPESGLLGAVERGFRLSARNGWRIALAGSGLAIVAGAAVFALLIVTQLLTAAAGDAPWAQALFLVPVAAAGAAGFTAFTVLRVAVYRALAGSSNGT